MRCNARHMVNKIILFYLLVRDPSLAFVFSMIDVRKFNYDENIYAGNVINFNYSYIQLYYTFP